MLDVLGLARLLAVSVSVAYLPGVVLADAEIGATGRVISALVGALIYTTAFSSPNAVVLVLVACAVWAGLDRYRLALQKRRLMWASEPLYWIGWAWALRSCAVPLGLRAVWQTPLAGIGAARETFIWVALSLVFVAVLGGGYVVQGVLSAASVPEEDAPQTESLEDGQDTAKAALRGRRLKGGRAIGYLERLILTLAVATGGIASAGFIIAAKGLARYPELKGDSDGNTEYFVLGTFSSALVGVAAGLALAWTYRALW